MKAYAEDTDYLVYTGLSSAPVDIDRLLMRASELIDNTIMVPFEIDGTDGLPTGTLVVQGINVTVASIMSDAVCAQVEFWQEVGEANDVDGLAGTDISVGSYSGPRAPKVAPRAFRILQNAGLV